MNQERKRWTWPLLSQQYGTLAETQLTPTNRAGLSTSPYFFTGHGYHMEDDVELLSYSVVDDDDIELLGYDVIEDHNDGIKPHGDIRPAHSADFSVNPFVESVPTTTQTTFIHEAVGNDQTTTNLDASATDLTTYVCEPPMDAPCNAMISAEVQIKDTQKGPEIRRTAASLKYYDTVINSSQEGLRWVSTWLQISVLSIISVVFIVSACYDL